ncbi:hypothetical protein BO94DRAFT_534385 [Aspergillus sclerotioniger CBS 115572]|uniref:Uncharacterized protein n=1 Tax=Aspergillus sclerotioniger CBS 115572 TaxID=1450535 RepID=A0A317WWA5_9EURO|nr:hypothetical protein BO94DRAFT_534385 [Aspergillus sclerotioniger CBS 115572]PWY89602.1 hypothetical protein BO94DRAFT_534385 [Aspergillus sclerotioniger CBS 115572]
MVYFLRIWWRYKLRTSAHNGRFERRRTRQPEVAVQKIELADRGGKRHWLECREAERKKGGEKKAGKAGPSAPGSGRGGIPPGGGAGPGAGSTGDSGGKPASQHPSKPASHNGWSPQMSASHPPRNRNGMPAPPTPAKLPSKASSRNDWDNQQYAPQSPIKPPSNRNGMQPAHAPAVNFPNRITLQDQGDIPLRDAEPNSKAASVGEWEQIALNPPAIPAASKQGSKRSYRPRSAARGPSQAGSRRGQPQYGVDANALMAALQPMTGEAQAPEDGW